jgi:CRP-like cAMP-binding protein
MSVGTADLKRVVAKLSNRATLTAADRAAILDLPYMPRIYEPMAYLVREGEPPRRQCSFVMSGYAFRQKLTSQGARQIVSLQIPGDFLDLQHLFLRLADHNVQALTRLETLEIDRTALQELIAGHPNVGAAMWVDALIDASIFREWVANVGRRDARTRVAHLLCEFATRLDAAGLVTEPPFELPMTQEQIGDAVGLTSVHVNRTLKALAAEGLIERDRRQISFNDWDRLRATADFSALYLHLDQINGNPG